MLLNDEEYTQKVLQLWADWRQTDQQGFAEQSQFPNLNATESNVRKINAAIEMFFNDIGAVPRARELSALIRNLGDLDVVNPKTGKLGSLEYHHGTIVVNPAYNLPHDDIPALKNIRNMADVIRVTNMSSDLLRQLKFLKPPKPGVAQVAFEHLNARMKHITDNKIGVGEPETSVEEKTAAKKPIFSTPPEVTQAHELVDAMTLADISTVTSGMGRRTALANKKERLHQDIAQMRANGESAASVLQKIKDAIKKSGAGGIQ
jgi:hypothetical protein